MTPEEARQTIIDGVTEILGKPAVRWLLSNDQVKVLKAIRDLATTDPDLAGKVAQGTARYAGEQRGDPPPKEKKS